MCDFMPFVQKLLLRHQRRTQQDDLKTDIAQTQRAIDLLCNTRMSDAEALLLKGHNKSLYSTHGYSTILTFRALLTFKPDDIDIAAKALQRTIKLATRFRRFSRTLLGDILLGGPSIRVFKKMTSRQMHAELVVAEASYLLSLVMFIQGSDGSLFKAALHTKRCQVICSAIENFTVNIEEEHEKGIDITCINIDKDFYSGIAYDPALMMICVSYAKILHPKYAPLLRVAGFKSDREYGLELLKAPGGWKQGTKLSHFERAAGRGCSGLRSVVCDATTCIFHVVVNSFVPNPSYDLSTAVKIVNSLVARYEHSIMFLDIFGVVHMLSHDVDAAIRIFEFTIGTRQECRQVLHCSCWYLFQCYCIVFDWKKALDTINILAAESMWSKATYCYHKAAASYTLSTEESLQEAIDVMSDVNHLVCPYGRVCLPIEKFVARKARKFFAQGHRLFLPLFELMYIWNCFNFMNVSQLKDSLAFVAAELANLEPLVENIVSVNVIEPCLGKKHRSRAQSSTLSRLMHKNMLSTPNSGSPANKKEYANYWDDYCLGYMLKGIIASKLAFYENGSNSYPCDEYVQLALACFDIVIQHSSKIALDHYIFYFSRFERARVQMYLGELGEAYTEFNALKSENPKPQGKGQYSFRTILMVHIEHALEDLRKATAEDTGSTSHTKAGSNCTKQVRGNSNDHMEFLRSLRRKREISTVPLLDYNSVCERYRDYDRRYLGL
ncbi:uncharacterized protein VTP21DRAFT_10834 [Calcarisporiella thermophila]|uniref:uncharacterized protein n=1 Tax=Calcarisporiella thermophila TaxID=911321 RepID=UPI003744849A